MAVLLFLSALFPTSTYIPVAIGCVSEILSDKPLGTVEEEFHTPIPWE